ncbi:MAG: PDDEXK nuclease domain-containing protein [Candidatus Sulfotelmatobacter sp.]
MIPLFICGALVLRDARAEYGGEIVSTLSRQLTADYGAGFSRQKLFHMIRFAEAWPDEAQVATLAENLGWSHFKEILYLKDELARHFYPEICRLERWSVRTLRDRVRSLMFERTSISKLPEATIRQDLQQLREADRLTPDLVFRDPYLLDFLGLKDTYSERDLEAAILRELERFLLELGADFAFVARQKRMTIGNQDYYLDRSTFDKLYPGLYADAGINASLLLSRRRYLRNLTSSLFACSLLGFNSTDRAYAIRASWISFVAS